MIHTDKGDNALGRQYYNMEQELARKLGDELGYARATNNIALIEKKEGNCQAAVRLALDAFGVFKQQGNLLGLGSSAIILSNCYDDIENEGEAISYAQQALSIGLELRELRMIGTACGSLANIYNRNGDNEEGVFASLCAAAVIKYLKNENLPGPSRDYHVFMSAIAHIKATVDASEFDAILNAAEKRVNDIVLSLNLDKSILTAEIEKIRGDPTLP